MKYTKTLDLLVQAAVFQTAGKTENAAKFFSAACAQKDVAKVINVLSNASQKAFDATQTAGTKKSLASLLAEIAAKKKAKKVVKKKVKASEDTDADEDMDSVLDGMSEASEEDMELDAEDEDLSDLDSMLENEMPEAGAEDDEESEEDEEVEMAKVKRVIANLDALNRLKASSK